MADTDTDTDSGVDRLDRFLADSSLPGLARVPHENIPIRTGGSGTQDDPMFLADLVTTMAPPRITRPTPTMLYLPEGAETDSWLITDWTSQSRHQWEHRYALMDRDDGSTLAFPPDQLGSILLMTPVADCLTSHPQKLLFPWGEDTAPQDCPCGQHHSTSEAPDTPS